MERQEKLEQLREDIPKLMESLHIEFQEILGFPNDDSLHEKPTPNASR